MSTILLPSSLAALLFVAAISAVSAHNPVPGTVLAEAPHMVTLATSPTPSRIELTEHPVRVVLAPSPESGVAVGLAARLTALEPARRIYLRLRDLRAEEQPGTLYQLYLDLPAGAVPGKDEPRHIGSLNFFNAVRLEGTTPEARAVPIDLSLDITDVARTLGKKKLLEDATNITIVPSRAPRAGSKPSIGRLEIVEQ